MRARAIAERISVVALTVVWLLAAPGVARGADAGSIELRAVAEVEEEFVNEKGEIEIRRADAATVVPGSEVLYTIYYLNLDDEPADNVVITNPIPGHMLLVEGSVVGDGAEVTFSADGGKTYAAADHLTVIEQDGRERLADASDYTHIRWELNQTLAAGKGGDVGFLALLL